METVTYSLNGAALTFSAEKGTLVSICHPGCGEILCQGNSLVDVAWPVKYDFETMRAAAGGKLPRSSRPEILFDGQCITVHFEQLAQNTITEDLDCLKGGVEAWVTIEAADDSTSLLMRCRVKNHSQTAVRQVIFPDFDGLVPVAGEQTRFTSLGMSTRPFVELKDVPEHRMAFYAHNPIVCGKFYHAGGYFDKDGMIGRWYDFGGLQGGMSLYRKCWGWGPDNTNWMGTSDTTWVKLNQNTGLLRIGSLHDCNLSQGEEYDSGYYVLTPHQGGWVQGIKPYKAWVLQNMHRAVPQPRRIKEMLGIRSSWITEQYPKDPDAVHFRYEDFPAIAADMLEHGLKEFSVWGWGTDKMPYDADTLRLGAESMDSFCENVKKAQDMGIRIAPLVSLMSIWRNTVERYGLTLHSADAGWAQNLKAVPCFQTPYIEAYCCHMIEDQTHPIWNRDVRDALRWLRDKTGISSIGWDQYLIQNKPGTLYDILEDFRKETYAMDPDAALSGESTFYFEADINHLDYTWDWEYWPGTGDCRAYIHVVPETRPNINVDNSPLQAKYCFMDNVLLNVCPSKPGGTNGSAMIADYPEFSAALKRCAALREQYLSYFADGMMLGDCVLAEDCYGVRVTAYRHAEEDRILLLAMMETEGEKTLKLDLSLYLPEEPGMVSIAVWDFDGNQLSVETKALQCELQLAGRKDDLLVMEVTC